VLRLVEEMEISGKRKTKENFERYNEERFGTNRSGI